MNLYFNVTDGTLRLPMPGAQGTRVVGPGESFHGTSFYDRFILLGMLGKMSSELVHVYGYVGSSEVDTNPTSTPHRFKEAVGGTPTCDGKIKYKASFAYDASPNDPIHVTYYFYTSREVADQPTHIIERVEEPLSSWSYPSSLDDLPSDFFSKSLQDQKTLLLAGS